MNLFDDDALQKSRALAETKIEDLTDEQTLRDILINAMDMAARAGSTLERLPIIEWDSDFDVTHDSPLIPNEATGTYRATWIRKHYKNHWSTCQNTDCERGYEYQPLRVPGNEPRLRIRGMGSVTNNSKNVKNLYLCMGCAEDIFRTRPPI